MEQALHISEVAALLLVAYAIGWCVGYLVHRGLSRRAPEREEQTEAPISYANEQPIAGMNSAAVATTSAAPVAVAATIPEPMRADPVPANASPIVPPAPVSALETLKSLSTVMPLVPGAEPAPDLVQSSATPSDISRTDVAPERTVESPAADHASTAVLAEPDETPSAGPANAAGMAWTGVLGGHEADHFVPPSAGEGDGGAGRTTMAMPSRSQLAEVPPPVLDARSTQRTEDPQGPDPMPDRDLASAAPVGAPARYQNGFPSEPPSATPATDDPAPATSVKGDLSAPIAVDEDSAMRDIEGGWSRRGGRAAAGMTDVSAAVSAAQLAVEQVLARNGVEAAAPEDRGQAVFGKPHGLPRPREGGRDDLKQIVGVGLMDESALNNLGIYHFDQIANLDEREVLWLENHAFARGRIGRENWLQQARSLGPETAALRVGR